VVNFTPQPLDHERRLRCPLDRTLGGPHSRSYRGSEEREFLHSLCQELNSDRPARSRVTILTELQLGISRSNLTISKTCVSIFNMVPITFQYETTERIAGQDIFFLASLEEPPPPLTATSSHLSAPFSFQKGDNHSMLNLTSVGGELPLQT
jgi:hypothetical protein